MQNYHFDTIRFWVDKFDIDGIRLDAADVLDFDFMKGLRRVANEVKPEFWLMGEVIHRASATIPGSITSRITTMWSGCPINCAIATTSGILLF